MCYLRPELYLKNMAEKSKGFWGAVKEGFLDAFNQVEAKNMAGPRQWMIDEINEGTYDGFPRYGDDKVKFRAALIEQVKRGEFDDTLRKSFIKRKR